jgi:hypothetical protein
MTEHYYQLISTSEDLLEQTRSDKEDAADLAAALGLATPLDHYVPSFGVLFEQVCKKL